MRRDIAAMAAREHDLVIVGGGIAGVMTAWDAATRGLSVALVEKEDFAAATTAGSSKLIHGGLRYLANLEISLVREALRERRIWSAIAPHMVFPLPFLVAVRDGGLASRLGFGAALSLYDLLAYDRNRLDDPDKHLPGHRWLSPAEAEARARILDADALSGGILYWDCRMPFPERLCLAAVASAAAAGAHVANHARAAALVIEPGPGGSPRVAGVEIEDRLTGARATIRARAVLNAAGPWADAVMGWGAEQGAAPPRRLARSKGIHLIVRDLTGDTAVAARSDRHGHVFVLPWRDHSIVGTTDTPFDADPDDLAVTEADIARLLDKANDGFPALGLTRADVIHAYAGLRALAVPADAADTDTYAASRAAEIVDHGAEGGPAGLFSALGGKWTTARHLAERLTDRVFRTLDRRAPPCRTADTPIAGGDTGRYAEFEDDLVRGRPDLAEAIVRRLARHYGTIAQDLIDTALAEHGPAALAPLAPDLAPAAHATDAEIRHAARHEMAPTLADVVLRRTALGALGDPGRRALDAAAAVMAEEFGWDRARMLEEVAAVETALRLPG